MHIAFKFRNESRLSFVRSQKNNMEYNVYRQDFYFLEIGLTSTFLVQLYGKPEITLTF